MSWFDDQIRSRESNDARAFDHALRHIAGAVTGDPDPPDADQDSFAQGAVKEILRYYHLPEAQLPPGPSTLEERLGLLLSPSGMMHREVELKPGWRKDAFGAMLGFFKKDNAPVAFLPFGLSLYRYFDPVRGKYVLMNRERETLFSERAYAFYRPFPLKRLGLKELLRFIAGVPDLTDYLLMAAAALVVSLAGLLAPWITLFLFEKVIAEGGIMLLFSTGLFLLCASVGTLLFGAARTLVFTRIDTKLSICVEAATMLRLLSLPAGFFRDYAAGELSSRASYVNTLCSQLVDVILHTGLSSLFSLIYVTQIFAFAPGLVAPALLIILVTVSFTVLSSLMQMRLSKKQMLIGTKESGMSFAQVRGIQKIRLTGSEKRAFARWGELYAKQAELSYNPPLLIKLNAPISLAITLIGTIILYHAALATKVSPAEYYAFHTAYGMVSGAFMSLFGMALSAANIRPIFELAMPLLKAVPETAGKKERFSAFSGGIVIDDLRFRYRENAPYVFRGLSLKIRPGEYVAIVGRTGCGKSTLVRLLLGFEQPEGGAVYFDGKDLSSLDPASVRRHIGVVTQNGKLFQGDIYSNIAIAAPGLSLQEAWQAAALAGIDQDIREMPMGMHTVISEGAGGISGGQKQRLMIARAIAPRPKLLILDEATSALDNITQKKVAEALDAMKCTRIVIAHRLSTIKRCDRILVFEEGRIAEEGSFDELMEKRGAFYALVERQRVEYGFAKENTNG